MWKIPLSDIVYDQEECQAVLNVLNSRWLSMGEKVREFEERFADLAGVSHAVALTNCTAALHLALLALDIRPGDEVVCPSLTFVAGANIILAVGAKPVFADIESLAHPVICWDSIKACLSSKTRAVQVMHYAGFACDMNLIVNKLTARGIPVVEDCAHALGFTSLRGVSGCYSFFPNKNMTTGEGGMFVSNDKALADRVRKMRSHGMTSVTWDRHKGHAFSYDVDDFGLNYRMDEIRAALGLVQLQKLQSLNMRRKKLVFLYRDLLDGVPGIHIPFLECNHSSWHIFPIILPLGVRDSLMQALKMAGIQVSIHYPPIHSFTRYRHLFPDSTDMPLTEEFGKREVTLPLHPGMAESDVKYVCKVIREFMRNQTI